MAQITTNLTLTDGTYQAVANAAQKFMLSAHSGALMIAYASSAPADSFVGHVLPEGTTYGDSAPTEKTWVKAKDGKAVAVLTKD